MNVTVKPYFSQQQKQLFNIKEGRKDGLLLQIQCPTSVRQGNVCYKSEIRFTNVAFNNTGQVLIAATSKGDIYNFNFTHSRFWYLTNTNSCTFLKFNLLNDEEIFIGKNNGNVNIIDVESGELVNSLESHKHPVKDASFAKDFLCVTSSVNEAIVWDLRTCTKMQALCISSSTMLKQVMFMPISDNILTCFSDDSIHIWKFGTFDHLKQIQPALWNKFIIKCSAFTRNGRILVLGGYSQYLAVFLMDTWNLEKTIMLPCPITAVKKLDFVSSPFDGGSNRVLSILVSNGIIYFYDMQQDVILSKLMFDVEIARYDSSYDGRFITCITTDGKARVYLLAPYLTTKDENSTRIVKTECKIRKSGNSLTKKRSACALQTAKIMIDDVLEIGKLLSILKEYGEYPEMHRFKIWSQLLQLPKNVQQYQMLNSKYTEVPFQDVDRKYPMENRILLKSLKKLLCALNLWCSFFSEVTYLPLFVFPFVKLFQHDPLVCFEAVVTILINWCQYWFEYYPLPPINILAMVENVFLHQDPTLLQHLTSHEVTSKIYAWSLLQTSFSEVLSSPDWLILWDHILSNESSFIIMVTVAYSLLQKQHLMQLSELQDFKVFYHKQNLVDVKRLITKSYQLIESTEGIFHPRRYLDSFKKLDNGVYPTFVAYPKAVVDYQKNAHSLHSAKQISASKEKEILERTSAECEKLEEVKRKIEEHVRMKEVDRMYKSKLKEDEDNLNKQTHRLNQFQKTIVYDMRLSGDTPFVQVSTCNNLNLDECSKQPPHCTDKPLFNSRYLHHYREFLETDHKVQSYTAKHYHKVPIVHAYHHQIDKRILEAITKAKTVANREQYLAQLAVTTGLELLEKIISQLKMRIKECSADNRSINGGFLSFMIEQINLTEQRIEQVLKELPADNLTGNVNFNNVREGYSDFKNRLCGKYGESAATV